MPDEKSELRAFQYPPGFLINTENCVLGLHFSLTSTRSGLESCLWKTRSRKIPRNFSFHPTDQSGSADRIHSRFEGAACDDQSRAAHAQHQSARRGARDGLRDLRLVHRRLRHRRSEGRQGVAGRVEHLTMKCTKCGAENREGAKFCNECAGPIEASCPKVRCEKQTGRQILRRMWCVARPIRRGIAKETK